MFVDDDPNPPRGATDVGVALPKPVAATEASGVATGDAAVGAAAVLAKKLVNPKLDAAPPANDGAAVGGGMKKIGCPS